VTICLVVLLAYGLSIGPSSWVRAGLGGGASAMGTIYRTDSFTRGFLPVPARDNFGGTRLLGRRVAGTGRLRMSGRRIREVSTYWHFRYSTETMTEISEPTFWSCRWTFSANRP